MLVFRGILGYLGFFTGVGYLIGRLFGKRSDDLIPTISITIIIAIILNGAILVGLSECGII